MQHTWAERPIAERVRVLKEWRHGMTKQMDLLTAAVAAEPGRTAADVRVSEILPLLAAAEFLEKNAAKILSTRRLGGTGRPFWLRDVESEIQRVALGRVLVIGPSNYPLLLPGAQVLQALMAGNAVTWKPGHGGRAVALVFLEEMVRAGLPRELLQVTGESVEAGLEAIQEGADKVFFTGSAENGRAVMRLLAEAGTPCVMELSGCAAMVVMPSAEPGRVTAALGFSMRLNGSSTCMATRRLLVMGETTARREALVERLALEFAGIAPVKLDARVQEAMWSLVEEARRQGATVLGEIRLGEKQAPVIVVGVTPSMRIAQTDIFAPLLSVIDVADEAAVEVAQRACPYGLSVSIFGEEATARRLAARMSVGSVVINDVIVPTADPRVPFGGRRASGFGVTRGAEGLLEMTAVRTVQVRRGGSQQHYERTNEGHTRLFDGLIVAGHGKTWRERWGGLQAMVRAAQSLRVGTREK